jgi:hypothetical protein
VNKSISEVSSAGVSASLTTEPDFGNWLSGGVRIPEAEPITDFSYEVPNYKDLF